MQAITTTFAGPTNFRGSRVIARCEARRISVPWDHALDTVENHRRAAMALAAVMCWDGVWSGGGLPDGKGYAFVCVGTVHAFNAVATAHDSRGNVVSLTASPIETREALLSALTLEET